MDKIAWGKFQHYHYDEGDLAEEPDLQFPFVAGSRFRAANIGVDSPAVQVNLEDFYKGQDIPWTLAHDEVHTVISGECEIEFHEPPLMLVSGKVTVKAGDCYYMPRGCRVVWRVLSDEPFRHYCICFPNPSYPIPAVKSVRGQ
jgi:mannose-6-phosphate isomerase-like protein (cupin superfamily)